MQPDDEIISRVLADDQEALKILYVYTVKCIRPVLQIRYKPDLHIEIDAGINTAFAKFLTKPPSTIGSVKDVVAWMYTVVNHYVLDQIKQRRLACSLDGLYEQGYESPISSFEEALIAGYIKGDLMMNLKNAMSNCSDEEKYIIKRFFIDHVKLKDIATEMHLPETTIKKRKERLLAKLRQILTINGINSSELQDAFTL